MLKKISKQKFVVTALAGFILLVIDFAGLNSPWLGLPGLGLVLIPAVYWLARARGDRRPGRFYLAVSALIAALIFLTAGAYYLYQINAAVALLILGLPLTFFLLGKATYYEITWPKFSLPKMSKTEFFSLLGFLSLETILFITLYSARTVDLLPSPWQALAPWFFILYAIATLLLFFVVYHSRTTTKTIILTSIHLFLTFAVAPIMYPLGYGFDAFVHRATETWIFQNGFILPKTPYYIGQYSFVVWLAHLTRLPLFYIDVYLVPILASLSLPAGIIYSLKHAFALPEKYSAFGVWLIPFVPFLSLHLTTPHNLVLLISLLLTCLVLAFLKDKISFFVPLLLALAALVTHPLLGAPIFLFTLFAFFIKNKNKIILVFSFVFSTLSIALSAPLMFIFNNMKNGAGRPALVNPLANLGQFLALYARPYWYAQQSSWPLELLYFGQVLIVPTVIALGLYGLIKVSRKARSFLPDSLDRPILPKKFAWFYFFAAAGFFVSAWLLRSWLVFPDIVSYEQGDFPLRLAKAALIFLLPFAAFTIYLFIKFLENHKNRKLFLGLAALCAAFVLMTTFYLSYPQRNDKARFPGLNVTAADFQAVEWIHDKHQQYDYIVLSNQLVSAAALTNYSFAKYFATPAGEIFYYSVPTGGPLYQQYGKMLYEGQKREYMEAAMDLAGVDTAYFVLNSYWANSDKIIAGAKKTADFWHTIDGGKVWIFIYER